MVPSAQVKAALIKTGRPLCSPGTSEGLPTPPLASPPSHKVSRGNRKSGVCGRSADSTTQVHSGMTRPAILPPQPSVTSASISVQVETCSDLNVRGSSVCSASARPRERISLPPPQHQPKQIQNAPPWPKTPSILGQGRPMNLQYQRVIPKDLNEKGEE